MSLLHASFRSCYNKNSSMQVRLKAVEGINHLLVNTAAAQLPTLTSGLRDSSNAPLLASLFSSVMKASEEEVQKGLTGSKALSAAALRAVGLLGTAVGDGDALAFVLPGLASGLVKVMLAAGITLFTSCWHFCPGTGDMQFLQTGSRQSL